MALLPLYHLLCHHPHWDSLDGSLKFPQRGYRIRIADDWV